MRHALSVVFFQPSRKTDKGAANKPHHATRWARLLADQSSLVCGRVCFAFSDLTQTLPKPLQLEHAVGIPPK
jgi:hypothetical protein